MLVDFTGPDCDQNNGNHIANIHSNIGKNFGNTYTMPVVID